MMEDEEEKEEVRNYGREKTMIKIKCSSGEKLN